MNITKNAWKNLRAGVVEVYGSICMKCGSKDRRIDADHIKPKSLFKELALSFDNIQVLCDLCNQHKGAGPAVDYRPAARITEARAEWDRMCIKRWGCTFEQHLEDVSAGRWGCKASRSSATGAKAA